MHKTQRQLHRQARGQHRHLQRRGRWRRARGVFAELQHPQEALRAQDSAEFHTALGLSLLRAGQREQAIAAEDLMRTLR
jgi:Flp pilus assembly protein TadD